MKRIRNSRREEPLLKRTIVSFALVGAVLWIIVPSAGAATINGTTGSISYTAAVGETNVLTIARAGTSITYSDAPGVTITATGTCTAVANVATCAGAGLQGMSASLGDMGDTATLKATVGKLPGSIAIFGDTGNDTITSENLGRTQLNGDDGNDTLTGGPGDDTLLPGIGNDISNSGEGDDNIAGGDGTDVEHAGPGDDRVGGLGAVDGPDDVSGGPGRDFLDLRDRINGISVTLDGVANDGEGCPGPACEGDNYAPDFENVALGLGNDTLVGTDGPEQLAGGEGNDVVSGLGGSDQVSGDSGDDSVSGGEGADFVAGSLGADTLSGDGGDDQFILESFDFGADTQSGGGGFDSISAGGEGGSEFLDGVEVSLDGVANDGLRGTLLTPVPDNVMPDIEDVDGTDGPDILTGSGGSNQLNGFGGADQISGGGGADGLDGGRGADTLNGGKGRDEMDAGGGPDRILARDGKPDDVRCGSALDKGKADRSDRLSPDCDKVAVKRKKGKP